MRNGAPTALNPLLVKLARLNHAGHPRVNSFASNGPIFSSFSSFERRRHSIAELPPLFEGKGNTCPRRLSVVPKACVLVGQVFRGTLWVRRIVNPPAARGRTRPSRGESPTPSAASPLCGAGAFAQCHLNKPGVVRRKKCACARSVERPFRLPRRRPCRRSSGNAGRHPGAIQAKRRLHGAPRTTRNCNPAEFMARRGRRWPRPAVQADFPTIHSGHRSGLFKWH